MTAGEKRPRAGPAGRGRILLAVCAAAFMATLDTSIVNVALPQIAQDFAIDLAGVSWVIVAYLLTNVSLLLASGRLADMLRPGRLFMVGVAVFTAASAACAGSPGLSWLVAARVAQGLGGALMLGTAPKIILAMYAPGERGLALGLFSTAFATGISVGAPLGGWITAAWGWPYIFLINLPLGLGAVLAGGRGLGRLGAASSWRWRNFDVAGSLGLGASLWLLILGLNRIRATGPGEVTTLVLLISAGTVFGGLLLLERRQAFPLLHPELWKSRAFILGSATVVLTFMAVMRAFFLLPFYLGQIFHFSLQRTGLFLAILSFSNALVSPVGGLMADRWGNMRVLQMGSMLVLVGLIWLGLNGPQTPAGVLAANLALMGLGFGLFQAPNLNEVLRPVDPALSGLAASTNAVLKNLGALLGITAMVLVVSLVAGPLAQGTCLSAGCFRTAFAVAAGVAVLNLGVNLVPRQGRGGGTGRI